eukprot:m51a1_g10435 putative deoxycytidine triphosphate deaminase (230) ;mRNA; r:49539-51071
MAAATEQTHAHGAVLSDMDIEREIGAGNVIVSPFSRANLANCSYDVTVGDWYYRNTVIMDVFNPWCEAHVRKFWGEPLRADSEGAERVGLKAGTKYITLQPGETILGHTNEFIGGRGSITTMMKARSSLGRSCIAVCKCAGWGDIGYVNRWTMEITNLSTTTPIVLPVGARVAQIVFIYAGETRRQYAGKYQAAQDPDQSPDALVRRLEASWSPEAMIPKLWLDRLPCL